ncbi:MAG: hypothetical protein AAF960_06630 [Bacteroidota bacterium]
MKGTFLSIFFFLAVNLVQAQNEFQNAFKNNSKASVEHLRINFSDDLGNTTHLPISILKGKNEGPVFTIVAGVHGFEYPPIVATQLYNLATPPINVNETVMCISSLEEE